MKTEVVHWKGFNLDQRRWAREEESAMFYLRSWILWPEELVARRFVEWFASDILRYLLLIVPTSPTLIVRIMGGWKKAIAFIDPGILDTVRLCKYPIHVRDPRGLSEPPYILMPNHEGHGLPVHGIVQRSRFYRLINSFSSLDNL